MVLVGILPLRSDQCSTRAQAQCRLEVDKSWTVRPPRLWCYSPWLKRDASWAWHASADGELCYECKDRWRDEISAAVSEAGLLGTSDFASAWILNSARALLNKHLFASRHRELTDWPAAWPDWAHDPKRLKIQYADYKARHEIA